MYWSLGFVVCVGYGEFSLRLCFCMCCRAEGGWEYGSGEWMGKVILCLLVCVSNNWELSDDLR